MSDGPLPAVGAAWAKAGSGYVPHPLVCHAIDTAAVAERLYEVLLGPAVRAALESGLAPLGSPRSWVAVLCGLHDLGKLSPAFQALRADLARERMGETFQESLEFAQPRTGLGRWDTPHGVLTAAHFRKRLREWGASVGVVDALACALGGHHGSLLDPQQVWHASKEYGQIGTGRWAACRDELVDTVAALWGLPAPATGRWSAVELPVWAVVGLAGLTTVSDWIASDQTKFPPRPDVTELDGYREEARQRAREALEKLGWTPWRPPRDAEYRALFPRDAGPRPLQEAAAELVSAQKRPGVLVVEAPTGEGKTKLALQCAALLAGNLGLSGMYVAMPTRATSNQIRAEVNDFLAVTDSPLRASLVHSSAREQQEATAHAPSSEQDAEVCSQEVGIDESDDAVAEAREWFTRKKGLLFPIGVGTIDQALQAVIRSKHVFVRLTGLTNKVLVLDEVHAYDTYTSWLLDRLLWWCGRLGIPVVLMSATLPANRREDLLAAWRAGARAEGTTQVRETVEQPGEWQLTWADASGRAPLVGVELSATNKRSEADESRGPLLRRIQDDALVGWLRDRVEHEGCAVVIHNTVRRVEETCAQLRAAREDWEGCPELIQITGQLSPEQRRAVEDDLRARFGPQPTRSRHAIVVGTQVLEQSLDVDFDAMVTDPCPVDLLIQRAGRLQRHRGKDQDRPAALCPAELAVTGVSQNKDGSIRFPPWTTAIYDKSVLLSTWAAIEHRDELRLPESIPKLIHTVYVEQLAPVGTERQVRQWDTARQRSARIQDRDEYRAQVVCLPQLRDGASIRQLTRAPTSATRTRKDRPDKEEDRGQ